MPIQAYIHYQVDDKAFQRAARTRAGADDSDFTRLFLSVKTKDDLIAAWTEIFDRAAAAGTSVDLVCLFLHASKEDDGEDGFEFASLNGESGTFTRDEMSELEKLPWVDGNKVRLELFGCNTGLRQNRGWCPAEHLAQTQGVPSCGETGFAYFSKVPDHYESQVPEDRDIFLHGYFRRKNVPLLVVGDGTKMPTRVFDPYIKHSVGVSSPNEVTDVKAVQQFLNDVPSDKGGPDPKLVEAGLIGPKTINAIKVFQNAQLGFQDGVVDSGQRTLTKLIEFKTF